MKTRALESDRMVRERVTRTHGPPWRVLRNQAGYAYALARGRWSILHLDAGTRRNEACVDAVVQILNGAQTKAGAK